MLDAQRPAAKEQPAFNPSGAGYFLLSFLVSRDAGVQASDIQVGTPIFGSRYLLTTYQTTTNTMIIKISFIGLGLLCSCFLYSIEPLLSI